MNDASSAPLGCRDLTVAVPDRTLVTTLRLDVRRGSVLAVLGRNGAGKSSTLHTLAGLRAATTGDVQVEGRSLGQWPRRVLARALGLMPQLSEDPFPATALEAVLVGRHPHIGFWDWEDAADRAAARAALQAVDLDGLEQRDVSTL